jgi:hypothetical protein
MILADPEDTIPCPRTADETWPPMTDRDTLPSLEPVEVEARLPGSLDYEEEEVEW